MEINAYVYNNIQTTLDFHDVTTLWNLKNVKNLCISNFYDCFTNGLMAIIDWIALSIGLLCVYYYLLKN